MIHACPQTGVVLLLPLAFKRAVDAAAQRTCRRKLGEDKGHLADVLHPGAAGLHQQGGRPALPDEVGEELLVIRQERAEVVGVNNA